MEMRPIARADRQVSAIGIGTRGWVTRRGRTDGPRAIGLAIDTGCTLIDVAPTWADAQQVVGETIRELRARDRVVVTSLVEPLTARPPPLVPGALIVSLRPRLPRLSDVLPPAYVQRVVEDSLRALRLDAIPLALINGWRDTWLEDRAWPELRATLDRLVFEGKVLAWGVAARDGGADDAVLACAQPWVAAVQVRRSLFDHSADQQLLPAASAAGTAVLVREPLAGGALTGELGVGAQFLPRDERARWPLDRIESIVADLARLAAIVTIAPPAAATTEEGRRILGTMRRGEDVLRGSLADLALRDAIDPPAITAAVVGARSVEHVLANMLCADERRLSPSLRAALDGRSWGSSWYAAS
jgi:aryl-alcohol dehydrogenase-like predicted oxidoreductase